MTAAVETPRQRHTSTPVVGRKRTEAANAARRKAYAVKVAMDLACRLDEVDDARVAALAGVLLAECRSRGVAPAVVDD